MDASSLLRTVGALGLVLLIAGGLWLVRRLNLRLPGAVGGGQRLERSSAQPSTNGIRHC